MTQDNIGEKDSELCCVIQAASLMGKIFAYLQKKNGEEINQEKVIFAHLQLEKFGNVRFKI